MLLDYPIARAPNAGEFRIAFGRKRQGIVAHHGTRPIETDGLDTRQERMAYSRCEECRSFVQYHVRRKRNKGHKNPIDYAHPLYLHAQNLTVPAVFHVVHNE
jgi:hypothetical protein